MRVWYFSEMAYHPAWEEGLNAGRFALCCLTAITIPKLGTSCSTGT